MQSTESGNIDDYRVYVDPATNRVVLVFRTGDVHTTAYVNAADAQKLIDAIARGVQQLRELKSKH